MTAQRPRIIVTRPAREAAQWVERFRVRGIDALALPLIAIVPCSTPAAQQGLAQAHAQLAQYRAVMFVSGNAVLHFFGSNRPSALAGQALPAINTRAWSPGPGTADMLRQMGVPAQFIDGPAADAAQFDSESLWQQVRRQIAPGDRVLIVRGRSASTGAAHEPTQGNGRDWLAQQIAAAGGAVDFVVAYERAAPHFNARELALARQAASDGSLWLLSSSEAVAHLAQALPDQTWSAARALATHPRIAQAARGLGFGTVQECRPALADVLASIESAE